MYDYRMHIKQDVLHYVFENYEKYKGMTRADMEQELLETLWYNPEVTGNGERDYFYYHNFYVKPEDTVGENLDVLKDAMEWFSFNDEEFVDKFCKRNYFFLDTLIRLYLLKDCISAVLNDLQIFE